NLLDADNHIVSSATSQQLADAVAYQSLPPLATDDGAPPAAMKSESRPGMPVHLKDIHLERGMQCVDCHFARDSHGDGNLYGETRNAVEIDCVDCHGTVRARAALRTSGPAAPRGDEPGTNLTDLITPFGDPRFVPARGPRGVVIQR